MAYRSDVRIIVSKNGYEELKKYVDNNLPVEEKKYNLLENTDLKLFKDDQVLLGWNSVKWYEYSDFKEVDSIMNGLIDLQEKEYSYRFARIGEQIDDIEERYVDGNNDSNIYLEYPAIDRYFYDDHFIIESEKEEELEV